MTALFAFHQAVRPSNEIDRFHSLGAIVDADIVKAAAQVKALHLRHQLGIQPLSIANQQPAVLLGLFN